VTSGKDLKEKWYSDLRRSQYSILVFTVAFVSFNQVFSWRSTAFETTAWIRFFCFIRAALLTLLVKVGLFTVSHFSKKERLRRFSITFTWFFGSLALALFIPNIGEAIAVVGGLAGCFILVFPGRSVAFPCRDCTYFIVRFHVAQGRNQLLFSGGAIPWLRTWRGMCVHALNVFLTRQEFSAANGCSAHQETLYLQKVVSTSAPWSLDYYEPCFYVQFPPNYLLFGRFTYHTVGSRQFRSKDFVVERNVTANTRNTFATRDVCRVKCITSANFACSSFTDCMLQKVCVLLRPSIF